jgi:hypothetical protein
MMVLRRSRMDDRRLTVPTDYPDAVRLRADPAQLHAGATRG